MPRPLDVVSAELQAKQAEIDELMSDSTVREAVDQTAHDLGHVTDYLEQTAEGITQAGEDVGENYQQLTDAVDGLQEILGTDEFSEALEATGEFTEGVQGGLESVTNVIGEVQGGLEKINHALGALQQIDDLRTADGAEALEAFADAFETVVDDLGPLVDKVPVLGPFLRLYGAGIRNIAVSAGQIEEIVGRNQDLYQQINPDHSLYLTPEYLASKRLRRLQAEHQALFAEAMEAAAAEREARYAPPEGSVFDPLKHVVYTAMDRCRGLVPDYDSDAFRRWFRTKTALDSAIENRGSALGGVEMARWDPKVDPVRAQELLDSATARLEAAQQAFETEGAEHQAALDAYNDCVKARIHEFSTYEGLDDGEIGRLGSDFPQFDMTGYEPSAARAVGAPKQVSAGTRSDTMMGVVGGALVAAGLLILGGAGSSPIAGVAGALVSVSPIAAVSTPFAREVTVDVPQPAIQVPGDQTTPSEPDPTAGGQPMVGSVCNGTDHFPDTPATDGDGNTTNSPSKQVIGAYFTGLAEDTRIVMEVARIGSTVAVVNADGYAEFQIPLRSYGSYEITSVVADVDGTAVTFDPTLFGSPFRVSDPEQACGQSVIAAPTTTTTSTSTTTTSTTLPATRTVPAGGGAVDFPSTAAPSEESTVIRPGTPDRPSSDPSSALVAIALGAVACGSALLGGAGSPRIQPTRERTAPRTFSAEDRDLLQDIYRGADEAGFKIAGISSINEIGEVTAGSKDDPVVIGKSATLTVRVGEDGSLIPRRGDTEQPAGSVLKIDVRPGVEFDSDGDAHIVWQAHVQQIDVATSRIVETSKAGPSTEEWEAQVGGRSDAEVGNDAAFKDWVVESMPDSPAEAVRQALGGWSPAAD